MCGIAGIFAYSSAATPVEARELRLMRDYMSVRGPDGMGEWAYDGRIVLGHRRLSIIDLSDLAAQPMQSADGRFVIVFNGEIYNYRSLRSELEAKGYRFRSSSDTEVLLQLYAAKGDDMVLDLRGMFAFALFDRENRKLLLARDPYGIKPLYYADNGNTLRFASQVKALLAGGQIARDPDPAGWVGFHLFGSVPEPFTVYRSVHALPAGSSLIIDASGVRQPARYFQVAEVFRAAEAEGAAASFEPERIKAALRESVRDHMVADVPVGLFLSAGIDSGALLGLMRDNSSAEISAITLGYEEFQRRHDDEVPLARLCAQHYGCKHTIRRVTEREFREDLLKIFQAMDQPTIDGINTWFVSKAAAELGLKAAISGLGGDELFGGYPSFRAIPLSVRLLAGPSRVPFAGEAFRHLAVKFGLTSILNPKTAGILEWGGDYAGAYFLRRGLFMPWELSSVMDRDLIVDGLRRLAPMHHIANAIDPAPRSDFAKVATLESSLYMRNQLLRDTDWASMAHSLEVRIPLVDPQLLRTVARATATVRRMGKRLLATSPSRPLPQQIIERAKTGFGTPVQYWLQRDERLQAWRQVPQLAHPRCPWARRWAYQSAAA